MRPSVLLAATLLVLPGVAFAQAPAGARYIVGFLADVDHAVGDAYEGARVAQVDAALRFIVVETPDVATFEARARSDERVRYVERDAPDFGHVLLAPNDARYNDAGHYGSKKIGAETAWDRTLGSSTVKVAVIDTGIRRTHEEFAGSGRVLQGWNFVNDNNNPNDDCGHGTHVSGTIGATINNGKGIAGLAQATILPVRALSAVGGLVSVTCTGSTSDLASALRYAGDQGAHVASNSWGGGTSTALNDAIAYARGKGVTIVAAAGNDGSCTNCVSEPWKSNAASVIVVSSTDSADGFSSFSSQGSQVDVAAPGSSILSTYSSSDASYSTLSGTSMATPHVAGVAALLKTLNPSWGYAEIDGRLKTTAVDLGAAGKDDRFGYGRINAAAATAGGSPTAPGAPTLDGATAGDAQVALSWSAPASDGGAAVTNYKLYRGTTSGGETFLRDVGNVLSATDTGLTNGVAYYYKVAAQNGAGVGAQSNERSATPSAGNQAPTACFTHSETGLSTSVNGACSGDADGTIASWSWSWGDGSPAGSGSTASHAYAAAGTYTVTLTVTDDDGATATTSQGVTVSSGGDPDPSTPTLSNGVARSDATGASGTWKYYKISVPAGKSQLQVVLDGPSCGLLSCPADIDLYVRRAAKPTSSSYDCRPFEGDSDETCTLANPAADWWYVGAYVYSGSSGQAYTIRATYS